LKKAYQIEDQRAIQRFEAAMGGAGTAVQLLLPAVEIVAAMKRGLGELIRQAGLQLIQLVMEREVQELAGERYGHRPGKDKFRWGKEAGWCRIDGQKVPVKRYRVREAGGRETTLGSYRMFQRDPQHDGRLWQELMRGLSTRQYGPSVRRFAKAYGIEKSVVSEQFIETSRGKLKELIERPLGHLKLCAVMIDGIALDGDLLVVALGIGHDGVKTVLGLRQGASENAEVVGHLCADLEQRGIDFQQRRLYVLDGARALSVAVKKRAGDAALIQRCQLHKRRNVLRHLPEEHQPFIEQKLQAAWNMYGYAEARRALETVQTELERINPSAARSLAEGMEETLTIHRLGVPEKLRVSLFSTNPIESALSIVEEKCGRIKKWQGGDMKLRWVASGLLFAEGQFRRVRGFREIPQLLTALASLVLPENNPIVAVGRKAG
jgi:cation transport regulator ChaB